jgi:hypothetical protein
MISAVGTRSGFPPRPAVRKSFQAAVRVMGFPSPSQIPGT